MLSVCPTPIGNLGDITLRVLETLKTADLVAAEDTRRTGKLLAHYGISKPLASFYEHNELKRLPAILDRLRAGEQVALVSDAGMPGICDPGFRLIEAALAEGLAVEVLPGPSAVETALVASGFPTDSFIFLGYLPRRKKDREAALSLLATETRTAVAFETPHRLAATLAESARILSDRQIAVCRELTKLHEEISRGTAAELAASLPEKVKGEIVLVFAPAAAVDGPAADPDARAAKSAARLLDAGLTPRQAADALALLGGISKNRAYRLALELEKTRN